MLKLKLFSMFIFFSSLPIFCNVPILSKKNINKSTTKNDDGFDELAERLRFDNSTNTCDVRFDRQKNECKIVKFSFVDPDYLVPPAYFRDRSGMINIDKLKKDPRIHKKIMIPAYIDIPIGAMKIRCKVVELDCNRNIETAKNYDAFGVLDFANASNLRVINNNCFRRFDDDDIDPTKSNKKYLALHLTGINFNGACNLQVIGDYALNKTVMLDSDWQENIDFSCTSLKEIGICGAAFWTYAQLETLSNRFKTFILPPTLARIAESAFTVKGKYEGWVYSKDKVISSEYLVFSTNSPDPQTFIGDTHSLPNIWSGYEHVIVPNNTLSTYLSVKNHTQSAKTSNIINDKYYFESQIGWNSSYPGGSTHLIGVKGKNGSDTKSWIPINFGSKQPLKDVVYKLNCPSTVEGMMSIENHVLKWSDKIPAGEYPFNVVAKWIDGLGKTHFAVSNICKLTIDDLQIKGGSQEIYANKFDLEGGETKNYWGIDFGDSQNQIENINYSLYADDKIRDKLSLHEQRSRQFKEVALRWTSLLDITPALYKITLCADVKIRNCGVYHLSKDIAFNVVNSNYTVNILDEQTKEKAKELYLLKNDEKELYLDIGYQTAPRSIKVYSSLSNNEAITFLNPVKSQTGTSYKIVIKSNDDNQSPYLKPGIYDFYTYVLIEEISGQTSTWIPLYSNSVKIVVGAEDEIALEKVKFENGSDILTVYKKQEGKDPNNWTVTGLDDNWELPTDVEKFFEASAWAGEDKDKKINELSISYEQNANGHNFNIKWSNEFSTDSKWLDVFNCNIKLLFRNKETGNQIQLVKPISFECLNEGKVVSNNNHFIYASAYREGLCENPFKLIVNNDESLNKGNYAFSIFESDADDAIYIENGQDQSLGYVKWKPLGVGIYRFRVFVVSDEYFVSDYSDIYYLIVSNQAEIKDLPNIVNTKEKEKGQINAPISTFVNGEKTNAQYSLYNAPEGLTIDQNSGLIQWDGKSPIGNHEVIVESTSKYKGETITTYATFVFNVEKDDTPNSNLGLIITSSSSAAGILVGVGATMLGTKLHKNKKEKKK